MEQATNARTKQTFCTFTLANRLFGVEIAQVQEVLRQQHMTRVPLAEPEVKGLMNLRGQIVTAIDLASRLQLRHDDAATMNVVIRTSEGALSLLVDHIGDVLEVEAERFELLPETMSAVFRKLIRGVYKLDHRLLLVINIEQLVQHVA